MGAESKGSKLKRYPVVDTSIISSENTMGHNRLIWWTVKTAADPTRWCACCVACVPSDNKKEENTDSRHNTCWQKVRVCIQAGQLVPEGTACLELEPVMEVWGSCCSLPSAFLGQSTADMHVPPYLSVPNREMSWFCKLYNEWWIFHTVTCSWELTLSGIHRKSWIKFTT